MHLSIRTPHINKEGRVFSWASLFYGTGLGLMLPIFPSFVESILHNEQYVGYFYSGMAIAMMLAGFVSSYFFKKFARIKVLYFFYFVASFSTLFFIFASRFYHLIPLEFLRVFSAMIIIVSLALMVRDFTSSKNLGRTEGVFYFFNNIGWLIGPVTGGFVNKYLGQELVFVLAGGCFMLAMFYIMHHHLIKRHPFLSLPHTQKKRVVTENRFKVYFRNKGRIGAYLVSVSLFMWYSMTAITVPLFILHAGYDSDVTGLVLSFSIIPFLIFEVPVGYYADKYGLKRFIVAGLFITAICSFMIKFSPLFILSVLFIILAHVGSAFIEPLRDVYFFKNTDPKEEDDLYGIFSTSNPLARFIAPAIVSTCFILLPFDWVFVVFGMIFTAAGFLALKIKC